MDGKAPGSVIKEPEIKKVVLFKHGMGFYGLHATVRGSARLQLEFKQEEMDDVLKSLFAVDLSGKGFISAMGYDAAENVEKMLGDLSISLPSGRSFLEDFLADIKGASILVTAGNMKIHGTIIGIDHAQKVDGNNIAIMPELVILASEDRAVKRFSFSDISGIELANEEIQKDLEFFLELVLSLKKKDAKNLTIHCDPMGDAKDVDRGLYVSYIQEVPVWKTSYRLVIPEEASSNEKENGFLSGWGLVENQTPNDWDSIELTLVAGMPVTFRYSIYDPLYITRKSVPLPTKTSVTPSSIEDSFDDAPAMEGVAWAGMGKAKRSNARVAFPATGVPGGKSVVEAGMKKMEEAMKKSINISSKDMGELFEYKIRTPVSIQRNQSALVPIVASDIESKKILLYNAAIHPTNPMACVEITNTTGLTLETGPITIIVGESLAGEAMLPFLNKDDTRLLNYALEQGVTVQVEEEITRKDMHRLSMSGSYIYEYFHEDRQYTYKIRNKTRAKKQIYIDHPKMSNFIIHDSPVKPEVTSSNWRFKTPLEPSKNLKFTFTIRKEISSSHYLWNVDTEFIENKVELYTKNGFIDSKARQLLEHIAKLNKEKGDQESKRNDLEQEIIAMDQDQSRIRKNLKVLGDSQSEKALKERLVRKLSKQEARYEGIKQELEDLEKDISSIQEKIKDIFKKLDAL